jgi:hypothetical protein
MKTILLVCLAALLCACHTPAPVSYQDELRQRWLADHPEASPALRAKVQSGALNLWSADRELWDEQVAARRQHYVETNPGLNALTRKQILAGKIHLGMNQSEVQASMGNPTSVRRSHGLEGRTDVWIYNRTSGDWMLHFNEGLLSRWSEY